MLKKYEKTVTVLISDVIIKNAGCRHDVVKTKIVVILIRYKLFVANTYLHV